MPATTARSLPRSVPQRSRTSRLATLLPNSAEEFFRRRLIDLPGLTHIALAVVLIAALATFHAGDPSWNVALPPAWARHIHNLLGLAGVAGRGIRWAGFSGRTPSRSNVGPRSMKNGSLRGPANTLPPPASGLTAASPRLAW